MKRKILFAGFLSIVLAFSGEAYANQTFELTGEGGSATVNTVAPLDIESTDGEYRIKPVPTPIINNETFDYGSVSLLDMLKAVVNVTWHSGADVINVKFSEPVGECNAILLDLTGKQIFNVKINGDRGETQLRTKMPVGIYIFTITNSNRNLIYSGKLAKTNK